MNVIEANNITKTFGKGDSAVTALGGVSFTIAQGEFVSIMGPSGSGKSTLMNIIGLLDVATTGEYKLDGEEVKAIKETELAKLRQKKIGFVFQSFNLLPRLNVLQNVILPMVYARVPSRQRAKRGMELLKLVGVDDRAKHKTNQISGGQTQRVAIARALANKPSLLLADEPTGNLDTKSSEVVLSKLKELNNQGVTIIIVTHNIEIAERTDRIIEIRDGLIVGAKDSPKTTNGRKVRL